MRKCCLKEEETGKLRRLIKRKGEQRKWYKTGSVLKSSTLKKHERRRQEELGQTTQRTKTQLLLFMEGEWPRKWRVGIIGHKCIELNIFRSKAYAWMGILLHVTTVGAVEALWLNHDREAPRKEKKLKMGSLCAVVCIRHASLISFLQVKKNQIYLKLGTRYFAFFCMLTPKCFRGISLPTTTWEYEDSSSWPLCVCAENPSECSRDLVLCSQDI